MSEFIKLFCQKNDLSFLGMRNTAQELLPKSKVERDQLYYARKRFNKFISFR